MVRNERVPRGDSIAERYGRPVTADDIEELLHREGVRSGTISKVMQAVRQAIVWNRAASLRPWAEAIEDGLTRQEERRASARRAALAEQLRSEGRERAAAIVELHPAVNSEVPAPAREQQGQDAPVAASSRAQEAVEAPAGVMARGGGSEASEALQEAVTEDVAAELQELPEQEDVRELTAEDLDFIEAAWAEEPEEPEEIEIPHSEAEDVAEAAAEEPAATLAAVPAGDAPGEPLAAPQAVAEPAPGVVAPPAVPDAPVAISGPQERKCCSRCGREMNLDFFQKDKRSRDGRRPECKGCSAIGDTLRRSLRKNLSKAADRITADIAEAERLLAVAEQARLKAEAKALREEIPDPAPDPGEGRQCGHCGVRKPESGFYQRADGRLRGVCADCERREANARKIARKAVRAAAREAG